MAKGFINIGHSGNGSIDYYAREKECLTWFHSTGEFQDLVKVKEQWTAMEQNERFGNKSLNIRGRHDARIRTNYTLSLPNSLKLSEALGAVFDLIEKTEIKNCTYTIFIHRGKKDGIKNFHAHLLVNERSLVTGKKDRTMQKKEWLEKTFRPLYEKTFEKEFKQAPNQPRRERIGTALYKSDPAEAKNSIQAVFEASKERENTIPTREEARAMGKEDFQIWLDFMTRRENRRIAKIEDLQTWSEYRVQRITTEAKRQEELKLKLQKTPEIKPRGMRF